MDQGYQNHTPGENDVVIQRGNEWLRVELANSTDLRNPMHAKPHHQVSEI